MNERQGLGPAGWQAELFRLFTEHVKDYAIFLVSGEGRVLAWTPGAERIFGYREQEILGQSIDILFTPEDVQSGVPQSEMKHALSTGQGNDDRWHVRKDGSLFWANGLMLPLRDESGNLGGFTKILRDRTEWKQIEQARSNSEASKAAVLETALDGIITIDHEDRILEFSPAAERLFGYHRSEVLGQKMGELIVPPHLRSRHYQGLTHYLATGEGPVLGKRIELSALHADGREFPVELAIVRVPTKEAVLFTGYIRDISDRRMQQRRSATQLAVTRALAEKSTLSDAPPRILQAVCEGLDWDIGGFWLVDRQSQVLRCLAVWQQPTVHLDEFERITREHGLPLGIGLPGRVWQSGKPLWLSDVTNNENFPRLALAAEAGLRSAFGTPLMLGEQVLGVAEFMSRSIKEPDAELLGMMATVGGQIGQYIQRQQAEEALQESEERFRGIVSHSIAGVAQADLTGRFLFANERYCRIVGRSMDELLGLRMQDVSHLEDLPENLSHLEQIGRDGVPYVLEERYLRPDGSVVWVNNSVSGLRSQDGQVTSIVAVCLDVTERKRTEQDLRFLAEASQALATIVDFESTLQRIAALAVPHFADWCSVYLSEGPDRLRQLAVAHVDPSMIRIAEEVRERWPPDPAAPDSIYQVFRTGEPALIEEVSEAMLRAASHDDEHFQLLRTLGLKSYLCVPLSIRGHTIGVITFVSAESGRRYTTADLALAQDLGRRAAVASENARLYATLREEGRKKDEFLAMLAHELRNPLAPIRSGLDLLGLMGTDSEVVSMIQQQTDHLVRLVDDLLDVSRIVRGRVELRREPTELSKIFARALETVRPLTEQQGQHLSVTMPLEPIWLDADPVRLAQVVGNLLNNASKYTEAGGNIWLSAEPQDEQVLIRLRDTGIGISEQLLPHVFDLFTQDQRTIDRSHGGLGIGLTVVKNLVEMHGGNITVSSPGPGQGSEFTVRLPMISRPLQEAGSSQPEVSIPPLRVLVVDDNVSAAKMLRLLLIRLGGHDVFLAHDGVTALTAVDEHQPDLVLLDIGLPGLDGYEVAQRLRQRPELNSMYIVAITGYGTEEDRRKSLDAGFNDHLVKPPGAETLQKLLAKVAAGRR